MKVTINISKNCLTCKHLESDWTDYEYGNTNYYVCGKKDDCSEARSDKMYDKDGKETKYIKKAKKCHEFPERISFNGESWVPLKIYKQAE